MSPLMEALIYVLLVAGLLAIAALVWAGASFVAAVLRELRGMPKEDAYLPREYRTTDRERAGLIRGKQEERS